MSCKSASVSSYATMFVQRLVEAAMLAAVSGLSYVLATSMGFEPFLGFFLPLPGVLSSMRGGPSAGRKTVTATFFLLLGARSNLPASHRSPSLPKHGSSALRVIA